MKTRPTYRGDVMETFTENEFTYISGKNFNSDFNFSIPGKYYNNGRLELVANICHKKKVLHIGCADHALSIKNKANEKRWLHGLIESKADFLVGVDISKDGVEEAKKFTSTIVKLMDVTQQWDTEFNDLKFNLAVFGEVIEHVDNPISFLQSFNEMSKGCVERILVTVPNAWKIRGLFHTIKHNSELVNTDHRFWFTPFTITKVLYRSDWRVEQINYVDGDLKRKGINGFILRNIFKRKPYLAGNIVAIAKRM